MILSEDEVRELTETENDKIAKLVNGKLLSATEKMNEGIAQLIKDSKDNSDKVSKAISKLVTKVDELKNKEQKDIDFSEVTKAIKELADSNRNNDQSEIIKGLIQVFATELKNNRTELQNIVDKMQPKDYDNNFKLLESKLPKEEKKPEEWQFDIIRNHGLIQSVKAKAIK